MSKPVVAIVGRPNVGKSTLFNRCVGARTAIVDDKAGVTRDRLYRDCDWSGHEFLLVDTGGFVPDSQDEIPAQIRIQAQAAIDESDVIIFLVDGKAGVSGADLDVANLLRRSDKPILLAVNKIDEPHEEVHRLEFYKLGLGEPFGLSAMRGTGGVGDLLDMVVASFVPDRCQTESDDERSPEDDERPCFSIALAGRPNVGKSSLSNVLCGKSRSIVSDAPGTTRDALDSIIKYRGGEITLIDTAGIRRKSKVDYGVEAFAVVRALKSIDRADVVVLVLDATEPVGQQDQRIASRIDEAGKAAVIVVNKWDLIEDRSSSSMNSLKSEIESQLRQLAYAEIVFTSAHSQQRVAKILETAHRAFKESRRRIGTGLLNQVINEAVALTPPPAAQRGRRLRIYYSTQVSTAPPTFVLFVNDQKLLTRSYHIYLERKIREAFGFTGCSIRLVVRAKGDRR